MNQLQRYPPDLLGVNSRVYTRKKNGDAITVQRSTVSKVMAGL